MQQDDLVNAKKRSSSFKRGIYHQMELFKLSSNGGGESNFDLMCDSIENIKSDIKDKFLVNGFDKELKNIEKIVFWYRTLEARHTRPTAEGPQVVFPSNMTIKINKNIRIAYELLIKGLNKLGLLD